MQKTEGRPLTVILAISMIFCLGFARFACCQEIEELKQAEDTLYGLLQKISDIRDDSVREGYNERFTRTLRSFIGITGSESYPLTKLKTLNRINPDDGFFTFYQWNLLTTDGIFRYFAFLKVYHRDSVKLFFLHDVSDSAVDADSAILCNGNWFGALYYKVITCKDLRGNTFYTLLGWSGQDRLISRKVIEILRFDNERTPHFGERVFPDYKSGRLTRVVFRFDASTTMSMKYEDQPISVTRKWNPGKRSFDEDMNRAKIVVFDHLVPVDPLLEGQYRFYVPSGDLFSGFIFDSGAWHFLQQVDARNEKKPEKRNKPPYHYPN